MTNDGTNTPNGASKNLYVNNSDLDKLTVGVVDIMELDPQRDVAENTIPPEGLTIEEGPGSNTAGGPGAVINNTDIRDFGFVTIQAIGLGEPVERSTDGKPSPSIVALVEAAKKQLETRNGALIYEDYIANKLKGKDEKDKEKEDDDKDEKTTSTRDQEQ